MSDEKKKSLMQTVKKTFFSGSMWQEPTKKKKRDKEDTENVGIRTDWAD